MDAWAKAKEKAKQDAVDKAKANGTLGSNGLPPKNDTEAKQNAIYNRINNENANRQAALQKSKENYDAGTGATATSSDIDVLLTHMDLITNDDIIQYNTSKFNVKSNNPSSNSNLLSSYVDYLHKKNILIEKAVLLYLLML